MADVNDLLDMLYTALHADAAADLVWWTAADLLEFADESVQSLARSVGCFVLRDASVSTASMQQNYAKPSRHISTVHVSVGGTGLRPATIAELEAKDTSWPSTTTALTPTHFAEDLSGLEQYTLYPTPTTVAVIGKTYHTYPVAFVSGATVTAPDVLLDYLLFKTLQSVNQTGVQGAIPDAGVAAGSLAGAIESAFATYYGGAQ